MKKKAIVTIVFCLLVFMVAHSVPPTQHRPEQSVDPAPLLNRVIARSTRVAQDTNSAKYSYNKRSRVEELNSRGEILRSTEKTYDVVLIQGWPFSRLIKIQG